MLINLNLNGLFWSDCARPASGLGQRWLMSGMMMMSLSRAPWAVVTCHITTIVTDHITVTASHGGEQTNDPYHLKHFWKLTNWELWNLSLVQNKLLEFNCNAWPGQSVNLLGKYWTEIFHHEPAFLTLSTSWSWMSDESWLSSSQICTR